MPYTTVTSEHIQQFSDIVGSDNILQGEGHCWPYGYDNSRRQNTPQLVLFPRHAEHIQKIVSLCYQYKIPLTARGRGTGTTGATVPIYGGIILSSERMVEIIKIDPANRLMVVQPGVTNQQVQDAAAQYGFFWGPDPTSAAFCSVGGNLAYNSAGPRAVKYGTTRDNVLGLSVVSGQGELLKCGVSTTKGVVGYDLTRLIIGSEGTLGVITEAILKLTPLPETKRTMQAIYSDMGSAAAAVSRIMAQPMTPCALEFIDHKAIEMVREYSDAQLPEQAGALLMIEADGPEQGINAAIEAIQEAASGPGLVAFTAAESKEQVAALWATRKALSPSLRKVAPKKINEDVVVPVSHMAELITGLQQLAQKHDIIIVNFGHAGNGNIHVNLLVNPDDPDEMTRAHACLDEVFSLVLALDGTISGEHGVGMEKQAFVGREINPATLIIMKQIKQVFDPYNILNPDKMFPLTHSTNSSPEPENNNADI